jgi:hypothetical protein
MSDADIGSVKAAVTRGSIQGGELTGYQKINQDFEHVVTGRARSNVDANLAELEEMAKQFGLGREAEGGASGIPTAIEELQMAAGRVADARHVQRMLTQIKVGFKPLEGSAGLLPSTEAISFDPQAPPVSMGTIPLGPGMMEWSKVKSVYDQVEARIGVIMTKNPALYLLAAAPALDQRLTSDDDRLNFGKSALAGFDTAPDVTARKELQHAYEQMKAKLTIVKTKLDQDPPGFDAVSLDAVGLRVASTPLFDSPFAQWATHRHMEVTKDSKEQLSAYLDFAAAVLLIGATIGTLGGAAAAAAVLSGGVTAATVASAGVKVANAADLRLTADAGIRPEDRLTSPAKASMAELDAAVAVALALLAMVPALKVLMLRRASSVAEDLLRLDKLTERRAREVVIQSIREVGVAETARAAGFGEDVYQLHKYLDSASDEARMVLETATLLRQQSQAGARGAPNFKGRPITPTYGNWVGWHGTSMSPESLQAQGGFVARGTNMDLYEHIVEPPNAQPSGYIGTTAAPLTPDLAGGAAHWADEGGYVYEIEAGEAWDTHQIWEANRDILTGDHPARGELEVAVRGNVPWDRVRGWRQVLSGGQVQQLRLGPYVTKSEWEAAMTSK